MPVSVVVVVLGDIGRSPRMCNHSISLSKTDMGGEKVHVSLVGYGGSALPTRVTARENISVTFMSPFPAFLATCLPKLAVYALKVLWQSLILLCTLVWIAFTQGAPSFLLLQNPPTIPSLAVCHVFCRMLTCGKTKLVVDWHNYGYTILALAHGNNRRHPLVRFAKYIESYFGPLAAANFCVTDAMGRDLESSWGVHATTLYDRPPDNFRPISLEEKHEVLTRLGRQYPVLEQLVNDVRPGLLVSSTSWTEDEDFSLLLDALVQYESRWNPSRPDLICVITGKGPLKDHYSRLIGELGLDHVSVVLPWLEPDDYPRLLACADLGVSLHSSSSGLDLPMKVVDMFGCGLPVAALNFPALSELVKHGVNGTVFENSDQLAQQLEQWFQGFPGEGTERRNKMVQNLITFQNLRWDMYWTATALPLLRDLHGQ